MSQLVQAHDWASTPLGPIESWPQSLKTTVDLLLASSHAMQLAWGPEQTLLYNDACAAMLGACQPRALGFPFRVALPDIWKEIEPLVDRVSAGETVRLGTMPLVTTRSGHPENTWWDLSCSPVWDEAGAVAGLLNVMVDATARVQVGRERSEAKGHLAVDLAGMRRLLDLQARLAVETGLRTALEEVVGAANDLLGTERGCIQLVSQDGEGLEMSAFRGYTPDDPFILHFPHAGSRLTCGAARHNQARLVIEDVATFEPLLGTRDRALALASSIRAIQSTPMVSRDGVLRGVLSSQFRTPHRPDDATLRLVDLLAWTGAEFIARHRADVALRESEVRHRALVVATSHVTYAMSPNWTEMRRLDGRGFLADTDMPSASWLDAYVAPEDQARVQEAIADAIRHKGIFDLEHRVRRADGSLGWTHSRAIPLLDDEGNIREWFGAASDVTERRRAEAVQREGKEELRTFLLDLSDALRPLNDAAEIRLTAARVLGHHLGANRVAYAENVGNRFLDVTPNYVDGAAEVVGRHAYADYGADTLAELKAGRVRVQPDIQADPSLSDAQKAAFAGMGVGAFLNVPLVKGNQLVAFLGVNYPTAHDFRSGEIALVEEVAQRTWAAIERVRAEVALRESEMRLRIATEANGIGTWELVLHQDGTTAALTSLQHDAVFGYEGPVSEWNAEVFLSHVLPGHRDDVARKLHEAVEAAHAWTFKVPIHPMGGTGTRWIEAHGQPVKCDAAGRVVRFVGIVRDVTDAHATMAALRASEARLRLALDAAEMGSFVWFPEEDRAEPDARTLALFGVDHPGEVAFGRVLDLLQPGNREAHTALVEAALDPAGDGVLRSEVRIAGPDGSFRWLAFAGQTRFGAEGRATSMTGTVRDITARKAAEAALREREAHNAFLVHFSDAVRGLSDPRAVADAACRLVAEKLGTERACWVEVDWARREYVVGIAFHLPGVSVIDGRFPLDAWEPLTSLQLAGQPVVVSNTQTDARIPPAMREGYARIAVGSTLATPVTVDGQLRCTLAVSAQAPRDWTPEDVALVNGIAGRCWAEVERAHAETALRESQERHRTELEQQVRERTAELEESRDFMQATMDSSIDMIQVFKAVRDETGEIVDFRWVLNNHTSESKYGEVHGQSLLERNPGVVQEGIFDTFKHVVETGQSDQGERHYAHEQFNGWFFQSVVKLGDGVATTTKEINDWKAAQAEVLRLQEEVAQARLRESEERLRQFGEASQDVLWIRGAETLQWQYLSPAFEKIYGLTRSEALSGDNYRNWQDLIVPEDRAHAVKSIERVRRGEEVTFEYRIRRPVDGEVRWLRDTDFPMRDAEGQVRQIGGVGHDTTELKQAEASLRDSEGRMRTLMEGVPQLIWRSCSKGLWTWASPQWLRYTGQSQEETHGWGWLDAVHPDDRPATMQAWHEALPHGELNVEYRVRRANDGAWRWHQTRSVPVRGAANQDGTEGTILEWLGTTTDIEDLKRLQAQQQVLVAELQHRTRNLLAVVRNVARRSVDQSPGLDRYDARLAALGRVQGFLSRSTAYSVPLADVVDAELDAAGDGASNRVEVGGPGVELPGESVQAVALALHELATNAVKYGAIAQPSGRLSVTWRVERSNADDARRLVIDWRESGLTMPEGLPARRGYGTELITRALPYQLRAETALEFTTDGVKCRVVLPANAFTSPDTEHIL